MSAETIRKGDVVSHDKYADDDRFLVIEVGDDGVTTASAIDPDTAQAVGRPVLFATTRLTRCGAAWEGWR